MPSRPDLASHIVTEIKIVLNNYNTILQRTRMLDAGHESNYTKQLLFTIFQTYMPLIETELDKYETQVVANMVGPIKRNIRILKEEYVRIEVGRLEDKDYISPLVLLLKLAHEKGEISFNDEHDDWGRLRSILDYLQSLGIQQRQGEEAPYWPGTPSCIFPVVPIWTSHQNIISGSSDRFAAGKIIQEKSMSLRRARLEEMKSLSADRVQQQITSITISSTKFKKEFEALMKPDKKGMLNEDEIATLKMKSGLKRIHLPGIMASWTPTGKYKPACLVDYCRFHMLHPPKVVKLEQNSWWKSQIKTKTRSGTKTEWFTDKRVWDADSCAEWAAFLELASVPLDEFTVTDATKW